MKRWAYFLSLWCTTLVFGQNENLVTVKRQAKLMGSTFEITVVTQNEDIGYININEAISEIQRVEKMISSWNEESETALINRNAGVKPVKVCYELFKLIERSKKISELTNGAFDISYAAMDKLWKFDGSMTKIPTEAEVKKSIAKVDYQKIKLDPDELTVFLLEKGMKIGFGAIGKGYAADKAKEFLVSKGVKGGIINASGDMTTWGTKATGEKWMIGIANPKSRDKVFSWLPVVESSVATSANFEKFLMYQGKRYSHIIDPRSGYPTTGLSSVSIFAKDAELCDALATAIFVMGRDSGIHMINQIGGVEVVVVDANNKVHKSSGLVFDTNQ